MSAAAAVADVLAWYDAGHRDLPWRRTRDPYALLVSEVMLQQTQVARVVPRYERFLERFPDVAALAAAPVADVLAEWSGLGYNRRALALRATACAVAEHGWPPDAAGLRELPGIGPYTAAAVASFAWDEPVAALDTNVARVITRIDGVVSTPAELRRRAQSVLPLERPAAWNQAAMELGATVCTARAARCGECPVRTCQTRSAGGPVVPGAPSGRARARFEDSDRWIRGRIVAALVRGRSSLTIAALRASIELEHPSFAGVSDDRLLRVLDTLERDALLVRDNGGEVSLVSLP